MSGHRSPLATLFSFLQKDEGERERDGEKKRIHVQYVCEMPQKFLMCHSLYVRAERNQFSESARTSQRKSSFCFSRCALFCSGRAAECMRFERVRSGRNTCFAFSPQIPSSRERGMHRKLHIQKRDALLR